MRTPSDPYRPGPRARALRAVARRLGDGGRFVLTTAALCVAALPAAWNHDLGGLAASIVLVCACLTAIAARRADQRGQRAMARLSRPAAQTSEELRLRRRFGLPDDSDARAVKADFALRMKAWHSDAGSGGVDMDEVKTGRNRLFHLVTARRSAVPAATRLAEWRREAGPLGVLWGRLIPSDLLLDAVAEMDEELEGSIRHEIGDER